MLFNARVATLSVRLLRSTRTPSSANLPRSHLISQSLSSLQLFAQPGFGRTMVTMSAGASAAKRLEGKTILITGASSGIGKSCAFEFARTSPRNLKLILTARRIDALLETATQIKEELGEGVKVLSVKLDVSNPEEVRGFVSGLPEEFKDIDVLVNNAYVHTCLCRLHFWTM